MAGNNPTLDEAVKNSEEFEGVAETLDELDEILDVLTEEAAYNDAAQLAMCDPEAVEYAEEMVGSLLIKSLGTVELCTGFHASARKDYETGDYSAVVVIEFETLAPGENEYAEVGRVSGYYASKFESGIGTMYAVPETGAPNPDDYERFDYRERKWNMTEEAENLRERLHAEEFDEKIVGGRDSK